MVTKRITFGEDEEKRMSNALRMAFGSVMAETPKTTAPPAAVVESVPHLEWEGDEQAREEYEKRVIMELVNRAKKRSRLKKEGVSEAPSKQPAVSSGFINSVPSEFVFIPFDVFKEKIGIAEKIVFLYLFSIAKEGRTAASLRQIVENTCIGKTCVCQALNTLRDAGWLNWNMIRSGQTRLNSYSILRWQHTPSCSEFCSKKGQCSDSGQCSQSGQCSENGLCSDSEQSEKSIAITEFVAHGSESGQCSGYEHGSGNEQCSEYEQCSQSGQCSENGQCSDFEQSEKSIAITEFVVHGLESGQCSGYEHGSGNEQCSEYEQRRKIVDTAEFRQDLVRILREIKNRDLKDLKDIKILKDLKDKDNKNKISDFVDKLCITHVDNSLVPEYLMTMFRIAFPEQSTEKLQVVKKLTERLQVGFAWYVVLLFIIKSSPYLMGKDKSSKGWKCTLTWALAADNYPKVMQLTYVKYGLRWTPQNFIEYLCRSLEKGEY